MAEAVEEAVVEHLTVLLRRWVGVAGRLVDVAGGGEDVLAVDAGRMSAVAASSASFVSVCHSRTSSRAAADDERAGHVGEAGGRVVAGPEVEDDRLAGRIGPWPISCPRRPAGPGRR